MCELLYIVWHPSVELLHIGGFAVRWYSVCWLIGLALAFLITRLLYREQKIGADIHEPIFVYGFLGVLIGARLGHCLFYEPHYFLSSLPRFIEMILPIRQGIDGSWHFTGYEGLASHGGIAGVIIAMILYCRQTKISMWFALDCLAIGCSMTGCCIRLGNLMNSEIVGKPTDVPWAFIFERVDPVPRHPAQLYEALAYLVIFCILWILHRRLPRKMGTGFFFGLCMALVFVFRFLIEYVKDIQEAFEADMVINMGQILSLPFIVAGILCMLRTRQTIFSNDNKKKGKL